MPNIIIDENEVLRDALSGLNEDVPPMPEDLHAAWMQKVEDDMTEKRTEKTLNRKAFTRFLSIAAALVFIIGGTLLTREDMTLWTAPDALDAEYQTLQTENTSFTSRAMPAAEYDDAMTVYDGAATAGGGDILPRASMKGMSLNGAEPMEDAAIAEEGAVEPAAAEKKIIRTARLTIYTQTFEMSYENLRALCEADGGWIEASNESTNSHTGLRTATLTLRVPQEALDGYLAGAGELGRITSRSETATDVTASYQDMQIRLDTQLALMERLQGLIPESADLSDLLALEAQIADTQYQIDALTASLARTDRQVTYSTVNVTLYEETAPALTDTSVSLGDRIAGALHVGLTALADFAQDMLIFLVAALPFIGVVAVVVVILYVVRRIRRRNKS